MKPRIMIVGAGTVGQATGKGFAKKGYRVTFVDTNRAVVHKRRKEGYDACHSANLSCTRADVTMFTVPTPSNYDGSVGLGYLKSAIINHGYWMKSYVGDYHLVVIRSTVPPGTTRKMMTVLERLSGLKAGRDFGVCMQPEFLRARSSEEDFLEPWATVIGELDDRSGYTLEELYKGWSDCIYRTDIETAEFMKYVHNCYNALKISFANEIWLLGNKHGLDANKALNLASKTAEGSWNPDYGITGGRPYGGMCLPKDVKGFLAHARQLGIDLSLMSAVDAVNSQMEELSKRKVILPATEEGPNWQQSPSLKRKGSTPVPWQPS